MINAGTSSQTDPTAASVPPTAQPAAGPAKPPLPPGVAGIAHPPSQSKTLQAMADAHASMNPSLGSYTPPTPRSQPQPATPTVPLAQSAAPTSHLTQTPPSTPLAATPNASPPPAAHSAPAAHPTPAAQVAQTPSQASAQTSTNPPLSASSKKSNTGSVSFSPKKSSDHGFMKRFFHKQPNPAADTLTPVSTLGQAVSQSNGSGTSSGSNPVKKVNPIRKALYAGLFVLLLVVGGGVSYFLMQQNQDLRQDASVTEQQCVQDNNGQWCATISTCCALNKTCGEVPYECLDTLPQPDPGACPSGQFRCGHCGLNDCGTTPCPERCEQQPPPPPVVRNCGSSTYDPSKGEFCCDDRQVCQPGRICKPAEGLICAENDIPADQNCGGKRFDPNTQYCCNGQKQYVCTKKAGTDACNPNAPTQAEACEESSATESPQLTCVRQSYTDTSAAFKCTGTCNDDSCLNKTYQAVVTTYTCSSNTGNNCTENGVDGQSFSLTFTTIGQTQTFDLSASVGVSCGSFQIDAHWRLAGSSVWLGFPAGHFKKFNTACDGTGGGVTTYNCTNNACVAVQGAGGTYSTRAACDAVCTPPPPPKKYGCNVSGQCVENTSGTYTTSNCDNKCTPPVKKFTCTSGYQCVEGTTGPYSTKAACETACQPPPLAQCNQTCTNDASCATGLICGADKKCTAAACVVNGTQLPWGTCSPLAGQSCQYCDAANCTVKVKDGTPPLVCGATCGPTLGTCANGLACFAGRCTPPSCQSDEVGWDECTPETGSSCSYCSIDSCSLITKTSLACGATGCTVDEQCSGSLVCAIPSGSTSGTCTSVACKEAGLNSVQATACTPSGPGQSCQYCDTSCTLKTSTTPLAGCAATCTTDTQCQSGLVCGAQGKCVSTQCKTNNASLATSCSATYGSSCSYCDSSSCSYLTNKGPYCGDGVRQDPEECDGGAGCDSSCKIISYSYTPPTYVAPAAGCNDACVTNADCSSSSYICYTGESSNGVCRLASNVTSTSCSPAQPELPEQLPSTGFDSIRQWLQAGLAALGLGAVLLLLL